MKKKFALALALALTLSLTACKQPAAEPAASSPEQSVTETTPDESVPEQPVESAPAESTPEQPEEPAPVEPSPEQPEEPNPVEPAPEQPEESAPVAEPEPVDLFTDTNETVYATTTVNIRSKPDTNSEKLGQLSWSDSVLRTGIDTASGWSEIQLADGSTAYISSKYLSTTKPQPKPAQKPSTQQTKPAEQTKPVETKPAEVSKPEQSTDSSSGNFDITKTDSYKDAMGDLLDMSEEERNKVLEENRKQEEKFEQSVIEAGGHIDSDGNIVLPPPW